MCDLPRELHGDGISDLDYDGRLWTAELPVIGEGLQPGHLPGGDDPVLERMQAQAPVILRLRRGR